MARTASLSDRRAASRAIATPGTDTPTGLNLAVVRGTVSRPPQLRTTPEGGASLSFEMRVRRGPGEPLEAVPVSWADPTASALDDLEGHEVLVIGRVRQRFFRVGGATQSRTELVADDVVPTRRAAAVRRAMEELAGRLGA